MKINSKSIIYTLFGVILLLVIVIAFKYKAMAKSNEIENDKLKEKIELLSNNYKRDSTYFINLNNQSLSKINSPFKDSILNQNSIESNKNTVHLEQDTSTQNYQQNNANTSKNNVSTSKNGLKFTDNTTDNNFSSNVTTYSKLNNSSKSTSTNITSNVTSYSKLKNNSSQTNTSNNTPVATTYKPREATKTSYNTPKATIYKGDKNKTKTSYNTPKATIYKRNKNKTKTSYNTPKATIYKGNRTKTSYNTPKATISTKVKKTPIKENSTGKITHGIPALDNANNVENISESPTYPGCESKQNQKAKLSCLNSKISSFVYDKFNTNIAKKLKFKGFHEVRVLLVINKKGKSKAIKTIGNFPIAINNEAKRVVNLLPMMKPGKLNGNNIDVKYSIKIPFYVR